MARGPSIRSEKTVSMMACWRWVMSASAVGRSVLVKNGWYRHTGNRASRKLLSDATAAIADMGFTGLQTEHMVAVENTAERHNVVVCTLCSCYPWTLLGIPPAWFKYPQYRARVVTEPRSVLAEFGVTLPDDVNVDVWDSSAEIRFW